MPVLYLQGGCGNAGPQNFEKPPEEDRMQQALRTGRVLGGEVIKLLSGSRAEQDTLDLDVMTRTFGSPMRPISEERLEKARSELRHDRLSDEELQDGQAVREHYYNYWALALTEGEFARDSFPVRLTVARLGEVAIACNSAELFAEYQLELKELSPYPNTMVVELTNGYCGYIPTRTALALGAYETWPAYSSKLPPEAGDRLVSESIQMLKDMRGREFVQEMERDTDSP
jgi:hypothetical protein